MQIILEAVSVLLQCWQSSPFLNYVLDCVACSLLPRAEAETPRLVSDLLNCSSFIALAWSSGVFGVSQREVGGL